MPKSCGENLLGGRLIEIGGWVWFHRLPKPLANRRAKGGAGLIITESCAMAYPRGAHAEGQLGLSSDDFLPGLQALTSRVHAHGAKIAVQLTHHGMQPIGSRPKRLSVWMPSQRREHLP